jgi:hypothetical protein
MDPMSEKKITVTVQYVGKNDFHESFEEQTTIGHVKRKAMHAFDLEESSANKYALQLNGTDLVDGATLSTLHKASVTLQLVLIGEVAKGNG